MSHIADVPGLSIGHAVDERAATGSTAVVFDAPAVCGVSVHGGASATRETAALAPGGLNPPVDSISLSGGSAFGVAAGDGVQRALHAAGRGFVVGPHNVPIVPGAALFDLSGPIADFRALGEEAGNRALKETDRRIGSVGAGYNATVAGLMGGLGSASEKAGEATVGAIVAVNAVGAVTAKDAPYFRAAPFERDGEFGGLGAPPEADFASVYTKLDAVLGANTTIAVIATDAIMNQSEAKRLSISAHDGMALAIWPSHTIYDGDTIFTASTGRVAMDLSGEGAIALASAAVRALSRAIALAVFHAEAREGSLFPTWQERFGSN